MALHDEKVLAFEFISVIHDWLAPEEIAQVRELNKGETRPGICHTHDFCDANMAMLEAAGNASLYHPDDEINDTLVDLMGAAWTIAISKEFKDERLPRQFECSDDECGGVFRYNRVCIGEFVPPVFCPLCGGETVIPSEV